MIKEKKSGMSLYVFGGITLLSALIISGIQFYYLLTPMSHWIEYRSVEPLYDVKVGQLPKFISIAETYRKSNVTFNDVLFCKFEGEEEFDYYINYPSGSFGKEPKGIEHNEWTFHPALPLLGECYCKSSIILNLPFGIKRVQQVKGSVFKITQ